MSKSSTARIKKLVYVHRSPFPGEKAHHGAIAKMIDAFSRKLDVTLVLRKYRRDFTHNIQDYFGLERDLNIKDLLSLGVLPFSMDFVYHRSLDGEFLRLSKDFPYGEVAVYYRYSKSTGERMAAHAYRHKVPFFCEVHTPLKSRSEVDSLREMKGIVVITEWLFQHLTDMGVSPGKILKAPSGVDIDFYDRKRDCSKEEIRRKLSIPADKYLVVYTGKPYEGRGTETLIESAKFLDCPTQVLIIGCRPEDLKRLGVTVKKYGLWDKVKLEGHKPPNQIPLYQLSADVLVMPYSQEWDLQQSASPVKMFEYMASGNPIVSSDFPIIREILSRKNSVLLAPDNPHLLAEGITKCLKDSSLVNSITRKALKQVRQYSWDNRSVRVTDFMNSVL